MFGKFKYAAVKFFEKIPFIQFFIYNNLQYFKFLFPHDKDYLGIKILFNQNEKRTFIDIGGNIGLSTIGFRELGFKNNYPHIYKKIQFKVVKYKLKKFDDIIYNKEICFIKIDVEGYEHLVIQGMKRFLKENKPIFLIEFNKSNFLKTWKQLKRNYYCYFFLLDKNNFIKISKFHINRLMKTEILDRKYTKNSINLFFIPKNFKKKIVL